MKLNNLRTTERNIFNEQLKVGRELLSHRRAQVRVEGEHLLPGPLEHDRAKRAVSRDGKGGDERIRRTVDDRAARREGVILELIDQLRTAVPRLPAPVQ